MRVSEAQLDTLAMRINRMTASPTEGWAKGPNGENISKVGHYHIEYSGGTVALCRMANTGGATTGILLGNTKAELLGLMHAYIKGYSDARA